MLEIESLQLAIHEPVQILSYDPTWPDRYEQEKSRLRALFPDVFLEIAHVGSTAVPEMSAKPVIDILGGIGSMAEADVLVAALCENGYSTSAEFNAGLGDQRWLMRHAEGHRTHHLHLVIHGGSRWRAKIAFRDVLRTQPAVARRYLELKRHLAATVGSDREIYSSAKSEFVEKTLREEVGFQN